MTLQEIQEAIADGKPVLDDDGALVLYADKEGYFCSHSVYGRRAVGGTEKYAYFFIEEDWPKPGNKFFSLSFQVSEYEYYRESLGTQQDFRNGNAFKTWGEAFHAGEKLIDKLKQENK